MAKPDEGYIPFGDKTACPSFSGYWHAFLGTSKRDVTETLRNNVPGATGVKVVKVKLVPVK